MPFNLLLFPLLGGYLFIHFCRVTRFRAYGLTGYRVVLEAAAAGLFFLILSHIIVTSVRLRYEAYLLPWKACWREYAPFPYSASTLGSILLAFLFFIALNLLIRPQRASKWVIGVFGDELMKMLQNAFYDVHPVMLTMNTGKVYVGLLDKALGLNPHMPYLSILPTLSGYRDKETLKVRFTVNYVEAYHSILNETSEYQVAADVDAMRVILPTETVSSARLYDDDLYQSIFDSAEANDTDSS